MIVERVAASDLFINSTQGWVAVIVTDSRWRHGTAVLASGAWRKRVRIDSLGWAGKKRFLTLTGDSALEGGASRDWLDQLQSEIERGASEWTVSSETE